MEIKRHCKERLPGGERAWRRACRIAGFDGVIDVIGLGQRRWSRAEIFSSNRGKFGITLGLYNSMRSISVFVPTSPCAVIDPKRPAAGQVDPLLTLCHELGHYRQDLEGKSTRVGGQTLKAWRADPQERMADVYGRELYAIVKGQEKN